jgi:uncharacterized membrane-anchored protein
MDKKEKFLILSGLVLVSSIIVYKTFKYKQKVDKNKRYKNWEAILVDAGIF